MARGNGDSSHEEYVERSEREAEIVEEREGLRWLAERMRLVRMEILRLLVGGGGLSLPLEIELRRLEDEFQRELDDNEWEAD